VIDPGDGDGVAFDDTRAAAGGAARDGARARWARLDQIFADALELADDERAAFLDEACAGDPALRREVDDLLDADRRSRAVLDGLGATAASWAGLSPDATISDRTLARLFGAGTDRPAAATTGGELLPPISIGRAPPDGPAPRDAPDLLVRRGLGEGGMGQVLLAWQRSLGREVAIKTVATDAPPELARALVSEARVAGALEHPVIPPVHALGVADDGRPLLVMKRIDGTPWSALLDDDDHPAWAAVPGAEGGRLAAHVRILGRVADAVHFAHGRGFLHRDVKPDNVMVGTDGEVYLVDWGIAVALDEVAAGAPARGTPSFMAPEMAAGGSLDPRSDVFLLGATLHRVLTGRPRHAGPSVQAVIAAALRCREPAYGTTAPADLARLAADATAADPAGRPPSARAFRDRLDRFLAHRAASGVAGAALDRVAALERALAGPLDPSDPSLQQLATEARFGLAEARRLWPDGAEIAAGLARVRGAAVRLELRRGNAAAARALLGEAPAPDPGLIAEVAELERADRARDDRAADLARRVHDLDPTVGLRSLIRACLVGIAAMLAVMIGLDASGGVADGRAHLTWTFVAMGGAVLAGMLAIVVGLRRALTASGVPRRHVVAAVSVWVVVIGERAVLWQRGGTYADAVVQEQILLGAALLVAGLLASRIWLAGAALELAVALATELAPARTQVIVYVGISVLLTALIVADVHLGRSAARPPVTGS
jgi:eukaryotic-like serine/threonine-protein kinase